MGRAVCDCVHDSRSSSMNPECNGGPNQEEFEVVIENTRCGEVTYHFFCYQTYSLKLVEELGSKGSYNVVDGF